MYRSNARQTGANEAPLAAQRRWGVGGGGGASDGAGGAGGPPPGGQYPPGPGRDDYGQNGGGAYGRDDYRAGPPPPPHQRDPYDDRGRPSSSSRFDDRGPAFDDRGRPMGGGPMQPPPPPPPLGGGGGSESPAPSGERKRKSRWGDKQEAVMPVAITGGVQEKDLENYALTLRLDEIGRSLRTGNVVPPDHLRSPSPPPTYDAHGRRTNTREVRYRKKLEDERMRLVERQIKLDPNFRAPADYLMAKRQSSGRPTDKVYIPVKEFPEINFFGLLVGPRGNSLKKMERESGARISIRGKGSVKEGKGKPGHREEDETDELHCLISAESEEKVQACVKLINSVIETAASVPEGQNDHKRNQLRELAALNGTLRDDENQVCQNCGGLGHRKYDCPEQKNWSANIICRICGGAGHMARDCTQRRGGFGGPPGFGGSPGMPGLPGTGGPPSTAQVFDSEYASLMAELGETDTAPPVGGAGGPGGPPAGPGGAPGMGMGMSPGQPLDDKGQKIPPWRIPENWGPPGGFNRGPPMGRPPMGPGGPHGGGGFQGGYPQQGYGGGGGYPPQQQPPQHGGYGGGFPPPVAGY
ncbi:hypothetical protein JCM10908_007205 [Rhodotorula pacifica]|uniref:uncharacterized protein n=1 Tax=Rhodotorula pacifica TaxID=1495444 RepID=UPI00316D347D